MASQPFGGTEWTSSTPADDTDTTHRAMNLLDTAEQVARKTKEEARLEGQRLISEARDESERIKEEARGAAPELRRATEELRLEQEGILNNVRALRDHLDSLLETHRPTS
jgi:cell division septum initiation protein DivIVA